MFTNPFICNREQCQARRISNENMKAQSCEQPRIKSLVCIALMMDQTWSPKSPKAVCYLIMSSDKCGSCVNCISIQYSNPLFRAGGLQPLYHRITQINHLVCKGYPQGSRVDQSDPKQQWIAGVHWTIKQDHTQCKAKGKFQNISRPKKTRSNCNKKTRNNLS